MLELVGSYMARLVQAEFTVAQIKDRPENVDENQLRNALTAWGIDAASLTYAPVGFGDYHWITSDLSSRAASKTTISPMRQSTVDCVRCRRRAIASISAMESRVGPGAPARHKLCRRISGISPDFIGVTYDTPMWTLD